MHVTVAYQKYRHGQQGYSMSALRPPVFQPRLARATQITMRIAQLLGYCGVMAVEFFISKGGELLVNEIAPRPHNFGHYTLDACVTSQFEQQVRTLCGLPPGDARLLGPAVMVNLLGDLWRAEQVPHWDQVLNVVDAKLHLYGKHVARPGRKMGHYTVLGESVEESLAQAVAIQNALTENAESLPSPSPTNVC